MDNARLAVRPPVPTADLRRRRGRDTRARIMAAAADLFAANGFDTTSTQMIAAASDITPAAMYRHFPSKADLFVSVAREALESALTETYHEAGPTTPDQIADIVVAYTRPELQFTRRLVVELTHAASRHPEVAVSLQAFHRRSCDHIAAVLEAAQHSGGIAADLDTTRAARDVLMLIMGICHIDALDPAALADRHWHRSLRRTVHATIGNVVPDSARTATED